MTNTFSPGRKGYHLGGEPRVPVDPWAIAKGLIWTHRSSGKLLRKATQKRTQLAVTGMQHPHHSKEKRLQERVQSSGIREISPKGKVEMIVPF